MLPEAGFPLAPAVPRPASNAKALTPFLKTSIILLSAVSIASIVLLFIGDFEGKFVRLFSTVALFAIFTLFTAIDTRRGNTQSWYAPVALIGNTYILGLSLIVIWITPYEPFTLLAEIVWKIFFVVLVTRAVIFCGEQLLKLAGPDNLVLLRFAFATSVLASVAGIMFTLPVGIEAFALTMPSLYWKIAVALLILTALGLAITLLLRWYYTSDEREQARAHRQLAQSQFPVANPALGQPQFPVANPAPGQAPAGAGYPVPAQPVAPPAPQPAGGLLPWPTFADGRPLPQLPDGQPDFSALHRR